MPEPLVWDTDESAPGVGAYLIDPRSAPPPLGTNVKGLPQNIVNSIQSCIEGDNRLHDTVAEYWKNATSPTPVPTPVITVLTPPDAVASGTAPISLQVTGSDFQEVSKVWFNNVVQPSMYFSATKLVAEVQKLAIGYYPVVVKTGDKVSNTLQFRFR
jgi:hypothetical protein